MKTYAEVRRTNGAWYVHILSEKGMIHFVRESEARELATYINNAYQAGLSDFAQAVRLLRNIVLHTDKDDLDPDDWLFDDIEKADAFLSTLAAHEPQEKNKESGDA